LGLAVLKDLDARRGIGLADEVRARRAEHIAAAAQQGQNGQSDEAKAQGRHDLSEIRRVLLPNGSRGLTQAGASAMLRVGRRPDGRPVFTGGEESPGST